MRSLQQLDGATVRIASVLLPAFDPFLTMVANNIQEQIKLSVWNDGSVFDETPFGYSIRTATEQILVSPGHIEFEKPPPTKFQLMGC